VDNETGISDRQVAYLCTNLTILSRYYRLQYSVHMHAYHHIAIYKYNQGRREQSIHVSYARYTLETTPIALSLALYSPKTPTAL
jgi:hypothetical protein